MTWKLTLTRRFPNSWGCDVYPPQFSMNCMFEERAKTLTNGTCAGHHNDVVYAIEGNGSRPSHHGDGYIKSDVSYTLNATEQHGVAYGIDQQGGKGMAGYGINVCPTLAAVSHGTPHAVAYGLDRASFNQGKNAKYDFLISEEIEPTLVARGPGAVACGVDAYNQSITKEVATTIREPLGGDNKAMVMECTE